MVRFTLTLFVFIAGLFGAGGAQATTYQVGPTRTYKQLSMVTALLSPGDLVEVDGGATYTGGLVFDRAGTAAQKITVRGLPAGGKRPVIAGGTNTIEARANHYVFEALDVTAGSFRCFFQHADDVTLRDAVIHDCPAHGILGADSDSGSFLLERAEVHHCGAGTQEHQIYMSTDEVVYPAAVFRMQGCYVHDGQGGNNVKSRSGRNEIYGNWIEGAVYHELELIGSETSPEGAVREDSDVVGNVLVKRGSFFVTRFGGDGTGQTNGRYRFVNNTVITQGGSAVFRLMDGIESLEVSNNVFAARTGTVAILDESTASWVGGSSTIAGQNNWIQTGATKLASGLSASLGGASPGFAALASDDLRPAASAPLVNAGAMTSTGPAGHVFPSPLALPSTHPPLHAAVSATEGRVLVGTIDIGAYELGGAGPAPPPGGDGGTAVDSDGGVSGGSSGGGTSNRKGGESAGGGGPPFPVGTGPDAGSSAPATTSSGCAISSAPGLHLGPLLLLLGLWLGSVALGASRRRADRSCARA